MEYNSSQVAYGTAIPSRRHGLWLHRSFSFDKIAGALVVVQPYTIRIFFLRLIPLNNRKTQYSTLDLHRERHWISDSRKMEISINERKQIQRPHFAGFIAVS